MAVRSRAPAFSTQSTQSTHPAKLNVAAEKKQKMSVTQTYYLAHTARGKLSKEAARPDHNLRLLVGHANLLDSLMSELADAEQEQEQWFNQTVKGAAKASEEPKHIHWADTIIEEPEEDWAVEDAETDSDSDSDSDSDLDEDESEDVEMTSSRSLQRFSSTSQISISSTEIDIDDDEHDDEYDDEDYGDLALVRTSSHQPPELLDDSEESSDDEPHMPPSPPQPTLDISDSEINSKAMPMNLSASEQSNFFEEGFYLPQRNPARLISAY
ncbi:MAG: hypothetical protein M1825_004947 [Sarcosagium campestre]|nr:MAG: hypothetical protein M1825_004947 [Sarcosagium campestre]